MRRFRVGEDSLETDAEPSNLVFVFSFRSLPDVGDPIDVLFFEGSAIVLKDERAVRQNEISFRCARIFRVLQELVDKVSAVRIEVFDDFADSGVLF